MIKVLVFLFFSCIYLKATSTPRLLVSCPARQYDNGGTCANCHSSCLTCNGALETNCLTCDQTSLLYKYYHVSTKKCLEFCYYSSQYLDESNNNCLSCHSNCLGCFGPNDNQCSACKSTKYLIYETNTCVTSCPIGSFFYTNNPKSCRKCPNGCESCSSLADEPCDCCNQADPLFAYRYQTKCYPSCPSGTYLADATNKVCEVCHESCSSCSSGSSESCESCKEELFIHNNKCIADCPAGFFKDELMKKCSACLDAECEKCTATGCQVCKAGKILSALSKTCVSCDQTCLECTGPAPTDCKTCASPLILYKNQCREVCPEGTFASGNPISCQACHSVCETCSGGLSSNCLTCSAGRVRTASGECLSCSFPCKTCIRDPTQCLSCHQGYFISGRYVCTSCAVNCALCSGQTISSCEACLEGYFMTAENECVQQCPKGTFPDEKLKCQPCHPNCRTCSGKKEENCNSCLSPKFLHNIISRNSCPAWTYSNFDTKACEEKIPITVQLEAVKNPTIFKLTLSSYQKRFNEYLDLIIRYSFVSVGELYSHFYSVAFKKATDEMGVVYIYITYLKLADLTGRFLKLFPPETTLNEDKYYYKYQTEGVQVALKNLQANVTCNSTDGQFIIGNINII